MIIMQTKQCNAAKGVEVSFHSTCDVNLKRPARQNVPLSYNPTSTLPSYQVINKVIEVV